VLEVILEIETVTLNHLSSRLRSLNQHTCWGKKNNGDMNERYKAEMRKCAAAETWDERVELDERILRLIFCKMLGTATVNWKLVSVKGMGTDFPKAVWKPF
jgi:hypothetical protein